MNDKPQIKLSETVVLIDAAFLNAQTPYRKQKEIGLHFSLP